MLRSPAKEIVEPVLYIFINLTMVNLNLRLRINSINLQMKTKVFSELVLSIVVNGSKSAQKKV